MHLQMLVLKYLYCRQNCKINFGRGLTNLGKSPIIFIIIIEYKSNQDPEVYTEEISIYRLLYNC